MDNDNVKPFDFKEFRKTNNPLTSDDIQTIVENGYTGLDLLKGVSWLQSAEEVKASKISFKKGKTMTVANNTFNYYSVFYDYTDQKGETTKDVFRYELKFTSSRSRPMPEKIDKNAVVTNKATVRIGAQRRDNIDLLERVMEEVKLAFCKTVSAEYDEVIFTNPFVLLDVDQKPKKTAKPKTIPKGKGAIIFPEFKNNCFYEVDQNMKPKVIDNKYILNKGIVGDMIISLQLFVPVSNSDVSYKFVVESCRFIEENKTAASKVMVAHSTGFADIAPEVHQFSSQHKISDEIVGNEEEPSDSEPIVNRKKEPSTFVMERQKKETKKPEAESSSDDEEEKTKKKKDKKKKTKKKLSKKEESESSSSDSDSDEEPKKQPKKKSSKK